MTDYDTYLRGHASYYKRYRTIKSEHLHFNFSCLDLHFLGRDPEKVMRTVLEDIRKPAQYQEKNGTRVNRHGKSVQKLTKRIIGMVENITAEAIHVRGSDGGDTMPHIHLLLEPDGRYGKNYSLLIRHILTVCQTHGLVPNFAETNGINTTRTLHNMSRSVKKITWLWKQMTNKELRQFAQEGKIVQGVSLLYEFSLKSGSLGYYTKSMRKLRFKLNRLRLDIFHDGHNLRDTYPLPLTTVDRDVITLIRSSNYTQKAMEAYVDSPILRDYIRYSSSNANTTTPYIVQEIKRQTWLLDGIRPSKLAVSNYSRLLSKKVKQKAIKQDKDSAKHLASIAIDYKSELIAQKRAKQRRRSQTQRKRDEYVRETEERVAWLRDKIQAITEELHREIRYISEDGKESARLEKKIARVANYNAAVQKRTQRVAGYHIRLRARIETAVGDESVHRGRYREVASGHKRMGESKLMKQKGKVKSRDPRF